MVDREPTEAEKAAQAIHDEYRGQVGSVWIGLAELVLRHMQPVIDAARAEGEMEWRRTLWLSHGHSSILYGDDGEMQCGLFDFKRHPVGRLVQHAIEAWNAEGCKPTQDDKAAARDLMDGRGGDWEPTIERIAEALADARNEGRRERDGEAATRSLASHAIVERQAEKLRSVKVELAAVSGYLRRAEEIEKLEVAWAKRAQSAEAALERVRALWPKCLLSLTGPPCSEMKPIEGLIPCLRCKIEETIRG